MSEITNEFELLHNPRCSKSRQTLALLEENGVKVRVREYLKDPLSREELERLFGLLTTPFSSAIRTKETLFKELAVDLDSKENVIQAICENPSLLERPIVIAKGKAVIGRPPEAVQSLF